MNGRAVGECLDSTMTKPEENLGLNAAAATVFERLKAFGVVPVVEVEAIEDALPLADALATGGLPVAEITFRTKAAPAVIAAIAASRPEFLLGAGTVLDAAQLTTARDLGAMFSVSPGFSSTVCAAALEAQFPHVPGVVTPSDVISCLDAGFRHLKFFPAAVSGGPAALAALGAPFASLGVSFMPTGGVTAGTLVDYLSMRAVFAVGGTWIAPRGDIATGRWSDISERAATALAIVREAHLSPTP